MNEERPPGIRWPKINLVGPTKEFLQKLWKDVREYAAAFAPISYLPWFLKKKWQLVSYTHLSRYVALLLTGLVIFRERDALWAMFREPRWPSGVIEWLVIICTAGTLYAFKIEHFERRRAVSDQELRFQLAAHLLLNEFSTFARMQGSKEEIEASFDSFVTRLMEIAAQVFSLRHKPPVHASLMVKDPDKALLRLVKWSYGAQFDQKLTIRIPTENEFTQAAPAAMALSQNSLVYVPKKGGPAWSFPQDQSEIEAYRPLTPGRFCVSSDSPEQEKFQTVMCAPIASLGVLSFSTREKDAFAYRDFVAARYFANVLGEAATVALAKKPSREEKLTEANAAEVLLVTKIHVLSIADTEMLKHEFDTAPSWTLPLKP